MQYLNRKDRQTLDKTCELFSESNNYNKLRSLMESTINSPAGFGACIPNLATYLRDIIHIDSAYPTSEKHLSSYRYEKLESIYSFIEKCQQSNYGKDSPQKVRFN